MLKNPKRIEKLKKPKEKKMIIPILSLVRKNLLILFWALKQFVAGASADDRRDVRVRGKGGQGEGRVTPPPPPESGLGFRVWGLGFRV